MSLSNIIHAAVNTLHSVV